MRGRFRPVAYFVIAPCCPKALRRVWCLPMLSQEEVLKIARLARLSLTKEEVALYQQHLGRVLDYIAELNKLETPKDAFVKHIPADAGAFREDAAVSFPDHDALIANAPASENNSFLLPTVLDHE